MSLSQLTFTPEDWNIAQVVVLTGQAGQTAIDVAYTIIAAPAQSGDPKYSGLVAPSVSATNHLISPPAAPTGLVISPDTGASSTDGITDTGTLTLSGELGGAGLSVEVFDETLNVRLSDATVNGTSFTDAISLAAGTHDIRVIAVNEYGQQSAPTDLVVQVILTPPAVTAIGAVSSPRNAPVSSLAVTFSAPIDPTTLMKPGVVLLTLNGVSVATSGLTFTPGSGNTYQISGLPALTTGQGSYVLTFDASKIADLAGNAGTGTETAAWLMDTTAPFSTIDSLPAQSTSTTFQVSASGSDPAAPDGGAPSGIVSFAIYDSTDGGPFAFFATVTPANPSASFNGLEGHTYGFYSIATDNAGNVQTTPSAAQQTVQIISSLNVTAIAPVSPNPRNMAVSSVDVTFSSPINLAAFSDSALTLIDNNGSNLITNAVTVSLVSGSTYQIAGLSGLTSAEGKYTLTVNSSLIQDADGNLGTNSLSTSWLMDTTPPTSTINSLPAQTTSTSFSVSVTSNDPSGSNGSTASGVASIAIYDSTDGGPFTFLATVTVASPSVSFTGEGGHTYGFYSIATDNAGNVQPTPSAAQQTVQILASLNVTAIAPVSPNPRNTAVSSVDVTFSSPINLAAFSDSALTLIDNNGSNLITNAVTVSLVSGSTYQIAGLSGLTSAEGKYTLTVNSSSIQDADGNVGTNSLSTSWLMDTTPPTSTVSTLPAQTTSMSFNVSVTSNDPSGPNGSTASGVASIAIYDSTDGGPFTFLATVTSRKSVRIVHWPGRPYLRLLQHRH